MDHVTDLPSLNWPMTSMNSSYFCVSLASSRFMAAKKRSGSGVVNGFSLTTLMSGGGGLVAPGKNKKIRNVNH